MKTRATVGDVGVRRMGDHLQHRDFCISDLAHRGGEPVERKIPLAQRVVLVDLARCVGEMHETEPVADAP